MVQSRFSVFLKAYMELHAAACAAGMQTGDVSLMLESSQFDALVEIAKAGTNVRNDVGNGCGLLVNGCAIFRAGSSKEDCAAFLKHARERLSMVHADTAGHG